MHQTTPVSHTPTHAAQPAHLWVGHLDALIKKTKLFLQQTLCAAQGCGTCTTCRTIDEEQHHAVQWLYTDNHYSLEDLAPMMQTLSFALEHNAHHFFVITNAEYLTPVCANSLLKSLEEPPPGYHFILLAQRADTILPTIISRCIVQSHYTDDNHGKHPLFTLFTSTNVNPLTFLKELDQAKMQEQQSLELVDQLLVHWMHQSKTALLANDGKRYNNAQVAIGTLKKALLKPPMPGSSNLYLKNLFLQLK